MHTNRTTALRCVGSHVDRFVLQVGSGSEAERKKQLLDFFDERAIRRNEEGLVVKDLTGRYMASRGGMSLGAHDAE